MADKMVIVAVSRVDADTENVNCSLTAKSLWIYHLEQSYADLLSAALKKIDPELCNLINTVITCNFMFDSYSRERCLTSEKYRPRDVLSSLGISLVSGFSNVLPNADHMFNVESACSSGIQALEIANMQLSMDPDKIILIAGVDKSTSPMFIKLFHTLGALSTGAMPQSVPFSASRSGFVMGEASALIAVTTEKTANKLNLPVLATVDAVHNKTHLTHLTDPSDNVFLKNFIQTTLNKSGKNLNEFAYWDAHATATPLGDQAEFDIFQEIFYNHDIPISSFKSKIGHCMSTSAVVEIVNAIENLKIGKISPTYGLVDPLSDDPRLITAAAETNKKTFIKTSFGFGGRNGAAVITIE